MSTYADAQQVSAFTAANMPKFSVIIVNYNAGEYLQKAIDSLASQTCQDFELILVDNNSNDCSVERLDTSHIGNCQLTLEKENHGFAKANNIAAKLAIGTWLVLLNPDAVAEPNWLDQLAAGIEKHNDTTVFASAQLNMDCPNLIDGAGDAYLCFGMPWRGGFKRPISELPPEGLCFSPCGASAAYKRDRFLAYGGFDERFFCYCEDVDLGYRMQLGGERCVFLPKAVVYHKGSGVSGRNSYFTTFHGNRNRTWTYLKNTPISLLLVTLPVHLTMLAYIYWRNRRALTTHGMRDGIIAGFKDGWRLRRQKEFRLQERRVSLFSLLSTMAWNPFLMTNQKTHIRAFSEQEHN